MSKKRTKKQKKIAALKRRLMAMEYGQTIKKNAPTAEQKKEETKPILPKKQPQKEAADLFFYDPGLIKKDLQKTVFVTALIAAVLAATYYLLEMGGMKSLGF